MEQINDIITADQAKKLTYETKLNDVKIICKKIEQRAKDGYYHISIHSKILDKHHIDIIKEMGYNIETDLFYYRIDWTPTKETK